MTRRDWVALASAIRRARNAQASALLSVRGPRIAGIDAAAHYIADSIAADCPTFDPARFLTDCGITEVTK